MITKPTTRRFQLGILERRRLGLTLSAIQDVTQSLAADGIVTAKMDDRDILEAVAMELAIDNPQAWADAGAERLGIDWDGLIGFLERILPLILQIIALFDKDDPPA